MSMRALERELGVPLLDRSSRGVVLLASGEALYDDAVPLLAAASAAVGRVRWADRGEPELLRIGHTPTVTGFEVTEMLAGLPRAPRAWRCRSSRRSPTSSTAACATGSSTSA